VIGSIYEYVSIKHPALPITITIIGCLTLAISQVWMQTLLGSTTNATYSFGWQSFPIILIFTCFYAIPAILIEWSVQHIVEYGNSIAEEITGAGTPPIFK
jgi:hypothetical protein